MIVLEPKSPFMQKISPQINPVIVIPMHKPEPSSEERASLIQCQKILGEYPIYLLHPPGMSTKTYGDIFPFLKNLAAPTGAMASIATYNQLMISPFIFDALNSYSHILIHEPDSIVLKNDLHHWCKQDFDYVGAPWFCSDFAENLQLKATGNFGFSLFKVKTVNDLFRKNPRWYGASMILRDLLRGLRGKKDTFIRALDSMGSSGKLSGAHNLYQDHCDIFWSHVVPKIESHFRVAPPQKAIYFSWEKDPQKCFRICEGEIPFGLHAWSKYDLKFLQPLLIKSGVKLDS